MDVGWAMDGNGNATHKHNFIFSPMTFNPKNPSRPKPEAERN
jgi:hypothetical protein